VVLHSSSDSAALLVEFADTDETRSLGLMSRPSLDSGSGMLFTYDSLQSGEAGFWMWQTRIPLDIAFLDSAGVILRILSMEPCESALYAQACPSYAPGVPYRAALEVNRGWFLDRGITEGDTVTLVPPAR
jgi:hypothetical protein